MTHIRSRRSVLGVLASIGGGFLLLGSTLHPVTAFGQTLPNLQTTFVPRLLPEPNACYQFACFHRASYDATIDRRGQRTGTVPTVVNLPALREPDIAP